MEMVMARVATGRAKGGVARAASLTEEERRLIATKAADARWLPAATHEGDANIGGAVIRAANLRDGRRVLSQGQFLMVIGRSRTPKAGTGVNIAVDELPFFLQAEVLRPFISDELRVSTRPISYLTTTGQRAVGYDALILPRVCNVYLDYRLSELTAHGRVPRRYQHIIEACEKLNRGLQEVGIVGIIDEATGYQEVRDRLELQRMLDKYLRHDLAAWAKRFPDDFYKQIFRLRNWQWKGMKVNRPQVVAHYTMDLVWSRLGPGIVAEMERRMPRDDAGRRKGALAQLLTDDFGIPELKAHFDVLIALMMTSPNWDVFQRAINIARPKKGTNYELLFVEESAS
jgi:P63C domain